MNQASRPSVAIVDTERVDRELRKITNKLKNLALDAMRKRGHGRKIEAEITLDEDGRVSVSARNLNSAARYFTFRPEA